MLFQRICNSPRKARSPSVDSPEVETAEDEEGERIETPVARRVVAVQRERHRVGQRVAAAAALREPKAFAGDVVTDAPADAR